MFLRGSRLILLAVLLAGLTGLPVGAAADLPRPYRIDPQQSTIEGSIKYSVIGHYHARFRDYSGSVTFVPADMSASQVSLDIQTASLTSAFPSLDRIVHSARLLDVEQFPHTVFQSHSMTATDTAGEYQVTGDLTLHGVTKSITFPFTIEGPEQEEGRSRIRAHGVWVINRRDFGISWHPWLDKGGILVGNHMPVTWTITAYQ